MAVEGLTVAVDDTGGKVNIDGVPALADDPFDEGPAVFV